MVISPLCYSSISFGVWEIFLYPIGNVSYGVLRYLTTDLESCEQRTENSKVFHFILQMYFIFYIIYI